MFAVGLTGGIASGKSTISNLFTELGVAIVDTDIVSRQLLQPGEPAYDQVRAHFGEIIIAADDRIDRAKLRQIVFNDAKQKSWLETMLHPLIYQRSHEAIKRQTGADYVIVVVPLLFETNFQSLVDRILVVDCPSEIQIDRLTKRDKIDENLARKMMAQQISNSERVARAHDVVYNYNSPEDLKSRVAELHQQYLELANTG